MPAQTMTNTKIVLASRPEGAPCDDNFRLERQPISTPEPGSGQMLLETIYLSLDPYMRGRMSAAKSYAEPVAIGGVMEGGTLCRVLAIDPEARCRHKVGDEVLAYTGWQSHALVKVDDPSVVALHRPEHLPFSYYLGVMGMPGMTAYTGLLLIGEPKAGETVVVAAASGAVGAVVGQIAKIKGCRVVGIAGGDRKCDYVVNELGFDVCIDHRQSPQDFAAELHAACPDGIDVYFENVGGHVFEAVFPLLSNFARIPVCGLIAHYNDTFATGEMSGDDCGRGDFTPILMRAILTKRLRFQGFIVGDFADQRENFVNDVAAWIKEGKIKYREDIVKGLENAPRAFQGLLKGQNFGKLLVEI